MSYHFTADNLKNLTLEEKYNLYIKSKIILPKNGGHFNIQDTKINDDIFLFKMDHHLNRKISFDFDIENVFFINILLEGVHEVKNFNEQKESRVFQGNTVTSFTTKSEGINKKNDSPFKSIGIVVKGDFLKKHFFTKIEDIDSINNLDTCILKNEATNIKTQICANELFYMQKNNDTLNDIYQESKVLEIIYNEFNDIFNKQKKPQKTIKLDEYDLQAIYKAKEILKNNIQNPPNINELSKQVKLNEFKLKIGFKETFNTTPYKFVEQCRMQRAKYLLENEDININEVASLLGYKYQGNFSTVFKRYFKTSPKDLMKSRSYYY